MTFKDKWLLDNPGKTFDPTCRCPSMFGYEPADIHCANPKEVRDMPRVCGECWNREMPEVKNKDLPHILDSGERRQFETGAVRDIQEGKGRCDLMPLEVVAKLLNRDPEYNPDLVIGSVALFKNGNYENPTHLYNALVYFARDNYGGCLETMFLEVAKHFEEGAKKYGENNWQKGLPMNCYIDSAVRHYIKWRRGDRDEPHDRAFVWNVMCCIWECVWSPRAKEKEVKSE